MRADASRSQRSNLIVVALFLEGTQTLGGPARPGQVPTSQLQVHQQSQRRAEAHEIAAKTADVAAQQCRRPAVVSQYDAQSGESLGSLELILVSAEQLRRILVATQLDAQLGQSCSRRGAVISRGCPRFDRPLEAGFGAVHSASHCVDRAIRDLAVRDLDPHLLQPGVSSIVRPHCSA